MDLGLPLSDLLWLVFPSGIISILLLCFLLGRSPKNLPVVAIPITTLIGAALAIFVGVSAVNHPVGVIFYPALFLFATWVMLRSDGIDWKRIFLFEGSLLQRVLPSAFVTGVLLIPAAAAMMVISSVVFDFFGFPPRPQSSIEKVTSAQGWELARMIMLAVFVAPVVEEAFFRGLLLPALRSRLSPALANSGQALVFGLIHFHLQSFAPLFFVGLVMAWQYGATRNIFAPILTHSVFNLANIVLLLLTHTRHAA